MTRYTVFNSNDSDEIYGRGLTAIEAMHEVLTYDGYLYEIRSAKFHGARIYELWHSQYSANSTMGGKLVKTVITSFASGRKAAIEDIAQQMITAGWDGRPDCLQDEDFDAMLRGV